ncbi:MAG: cytochrome c3 family protein [Candidatus Sulfotelmatobacter sp.]
MKNTLSTRIAFVFLLLAAAMPAGGVEHPGVLPVDADCTSCHVKKITGKSVHSAVMTSCTVCHVAQTQGDMTTLNLVMPKEQICFACHEKSAELRQHVPVVKASCLECHDAHSSDLKMLLRTLALGSPPASPLKRK